MIYRLATINAVQTADKRQAYRIKGSTLTVGQKNFDDVIC